MSVLDGSMIQLQFSWRGSSGNYVAAGLVTGPGIRRPARRACGPAARRCHSIPSSSRPPRAGVNYDPAFCNKSPLADADGGRRRHTLLNGMQMTPGFSGRKH